MSILDAEPIRRIRQNHALEHATMHILARSNPGLQVVGRSTAKGFLVYGDVDTQTLASAVSEGLARLQAGEHELAVHPRCGTGVATAGILAGLAAFVALQTERKSKLAALPKVLVSSTLAVLVSQPLGLTVQREITTSPNLEAARIGRIERRESGGMVSHRIEVEHS